ncbi:MAG: MATE family efflux transporter [Spirochaetaceae bacterium]
MIEESIEFKNRLIKIAIPIMLSKFLSSSISLVDNIMIGSLGEIPIAGVSLANEFTFIFMILVSSTSSGASIFIAQYWGKKDLKSIHSFMGICYRISLTISLIFFIGSSFFPMELLSFYSKDIDVLNTGANYLKIISLTFPLSAISITISSTLRSTERVKTPLIVSTGAIILNSILNLLLIHGIGIFPELGVTGAAIATLISKALETLTIVIIAYYKKTQAATPLKDLLHIPKTFWNKYLKTSFPVIINNFGWAAGMTICISVYSRMGIESITSYKISAVIMDLFFVIITASANASAIVLGNIIGTGDFQKAQRYGKRFLKLSIIMAIILGIIVASLSSTIPNMFNVSQSIKDNSRIILLIFSVFLIFKGINNHLITGFFSSGGDTFVSMLLNTLGIWFWAVPISIFSGLYLSLPIYYVFALVCLEEIIKALFAVPRFRSGKWIKEIISN